MFLIMLYPSALVNIPLCYHMQLPQKYEIDLDILWYKSLRSSQIWPLEPFSHFPVIWLHNPVSPQFLLQLLDNEFHKVQECMLENKEKKSLVVYNIWNILLCQHIFQSLVSKPLNEVHYNSGKTFTLAPLFTTKKIVCKHRHTLCKLCNWCDRCRTHSNK